MCVFRRSEVFEAAEKSLEGTRGSLVRREVGEEGADNQIDKEVAVEVSARIK